MVGMDRVTRLVLHIFLLPHDSRAHYTLSPFQGLACSRSDVTFASVQSFDLIPSSSLKHVIGQDYLMLKRAVLVLNLRRIIAGYRSCGELVRAVLRGG